MMSVARGVHRDGFCVAQGFAGAPVLMNCPVLGSRAGVFFSLLGVAVFVSDFTKRPVLGSRAGVVLAVLAVGVAAPFLTNCPVLGSRAGVVFLAVAAAVLGAVGAGA